MGGSCLRGQGVAGRVKLLCDIREESCREWDGLRISTVVGCGKRMILVEPPDPGSLARFLSSALSGSIEWASGCSLDGGLDVVGYGLRGLLARVGGVVAKLHTIAVEDNPEWRVLDFLSRAAPGLAPRPVCSVSIDNVPIVIAVEEVEGTPLAVEYIEAASRGDEPRHNRELARRLAELHLALYRCGEDWCKPSRAGRSLVYSWIGRVRWRAKLLSSLPGVDLSLMEAVDALEDLARGMEEVVGSLEGIVVSRIHGDLHLYQVYSSSRGLVFTDFEGEPYKEPFRRDELEPPARDLASLARSIDYAASLALMDEAGMDAGQAALEASRSMAGWRSMVSTSLVREYMDRVRGTPLEVAEWGPVLAFWMAERASYELVYEVLEGTGLHHIPLNAVLRLRDSWPRVSW